MKGYVLLDGKVGYRFIPKTACTSIKHALYELEENEKFSKEKHGMHVHRYINKNRVGSIDNCEERFIVIRDPIKRFLSAYGNRVTHHEELSEKYIKEKAEEYLNEIPFFDPNLQQFVDNLNTYLKVGVIRHHVKPISSFLQGDKLQCFTRIYRMENLNNLERDLSILYGKNVFFDRLQEKGKKHEVSDLTWGQLSKLLRYYKRDYVLLEGYYSKANIRREWFQGRINKFWIKYISPALKLRT